jgi:ATP-dependent Clp protease ATP-binding subunit ClpC
VFERFTDRARRVVVLAQEEARRLDHNFIGTEHLLLGLLDERDGVAAQALLEIGVSLGDARTKVAEVVGRGAGTPSGHVPFTPRAKKVLELSLREALELGHNYIGTEHILLGMLREGDGVGAEVLGQLGADLARVRHTVIRLVSTAGTSTEGGHPGVQRLARGMGFGMDVTRAPRFPGPRPVTCGFCGLASPACGALFTGVSGALICERCLGGRSGPSPAQGPMPTAPRAPAEPADPIEPDGPPPADDAPGPPIGGAP